MTRKKNKDKFSTIRVRESTKNKLVNLNFVKKGMSFEEIINEIIKKLKKKK